METSMFAATLAALALWTPPAWAVPTAVVEHGTKASYSYRTFAYSVDGHRVAQMVPCSCRAGYAIRNLTHARLIVRFKGV